MADAEVGYRHEALLYGGAGDFVDRLVPFIVDGLAADQPVLVAAEATKLELLQRALADHAKRVSFVDMAEVGRNPSRVISAWREFVGRHEPSSRSVRGVGEPVWPSRTSAELVECERHEALLNAAFPAATPLWLVCPYDTTTLPPAVIAEARVNHPYVAEAGASISSPTFRPPDLGVPFAAPLERPPTDSDELPFDLASLAWLRRFVAARGAVLGLRRDRVGDLVLAVNELATNSVRHGGGSGVVGLWQDGGDLVAEVRDQGSIDDAFAGRHRPVLDGVSGRGLWLVNQLCDLVQVRATPRGTVVRIRMARLLPTAG